MKRIMIRVSLASSLLLVFSFSALFGQEDKPKSRFSHRGIKIAFGAGSFENEFGDKLEDGGAGSLNLGYGFDDKFTLWLGLLGVEHPENSVNREATDFGGAELNLQYKLLPQSRVQPYGKLGVGFYGIGEQNSNVTFLGGGFALAVGADWFFWRHFGIGAELQYKNIDYSKERREILGKTVETDLNPRLDGKSVGLMFILTIQ